MDWFIREENFNKDNIELNGSRYLIGNGYMGYRGTLEEFGAQQLVALNLAGLFDQNGQLWRESVNAPNPFYTVTYIDNKELNPLISDVVAHEQTLYIDKGIHTRRTQFKVDNTVITVEAERFVSMKRENLAVLKYSVSADKNTEIKVKTLVDSNVWNINGDHFAVEESKSENGINIMSLRTLEKGIPMRVYEYIQGGENDNTVTLKPDETFTIIKVCGIYWGEEIESSYESFKNVCSKEYEELKEEHIGVWQEIWENSDVVIEGDKEAQKAMRYSIYHLSSIVPRNTDKSGIPARGLSGQVYKGASFWDTEMFMLPFFSFTDPSLAKNLVNYRLNTIDGAKRKANEFGHKGAFYAWESQETGDDVCTLFNITDVFTNRPMRTHFKDKQIHVTADVVYGLWEYCTVSGDYSVLACGGLDMIYQCLLFFYSYSCYKPMENRYEINDVVGPDEYHERVNNNPYTNKMAAYTAEAFAKALDYVKENNKDIYEKFIDKNDISWVQDFLEKIYIPEPDERGIIEQFDGYFRLEDVSLEELKERIIIPNEYLGGTNGLATTTRILKQADVVMLLNVFRAHYNSEIKRINWEYYEPYTEHGSSLSACAYAIVAAEIGKLEWAYEYFMKTATVDLTGKTKQYLGSLYIGGTHPAANGGSWNTAVFGFGGVSYTEDTIDISPRIPKHWKSLEFKLLWKGVRISVKATQDNVEVSCDGNSDNINITVNKEKFTA